MSLCRLEKGDPRLTEWVYLLVAFIYCLRHQLLGSGPEEDLVPLLDLERMQTVFEASRIRDPLANHTENIMPGFAADHLLAVSWGIGYPVDEFSTCP
jgi:predicted membrane chloride channel (bestrophin family)